MLRNTMVLSLFICSCTNEAEPNKVENFVITPGPDIPEPNIDSLISLNQAKVFFLDYWEGMNMHEIDLITERLKSQKKLDTEGNYFSVINRDTFVFELTFMYFDFDAPRNIDDSLIGIKLVSDRLPVEDCWSLHNYWKETYNYFETAVLNGYVHKYDSITSVCFGQFSRDGQPEFLARALDDSSIFEITYSTTNSLLRKLDD